MQRTNWNQVVTVFIALVWLVNGLICKVLNVVPRHEIIVGRILDTSSPRIFTFFIGLAEIFMSVWIVSKFMPRANAILQVLIIAVMNVLEMILVPDLLLWGKWNVLWAGLFILLILYNEFYLRSKRV